MASPRNRKAESRSAKGAAPAKRASATSETGSGTPSSSSDSTGLETGMLVAACVLLIAAFLLMDHFRGTYGEGLFFKP